MLIRLGRALILLIFAAVAGSVAYRVSDTYIDRMSEPRGYRLIAVAGDGGEEQPARLRGAARRGQKMFRVKLEFEPTSVS
jgi:hypothetical protein